MPYLIILNFHHGTLKLFKLLGSCVSWLVMPFFYITLINHFVLIGKDYASLHSVRIHNDCLVVSQLINMFIISQAVKKGDTIFIGKYLFTGSETASVWLEVMQSWIDYYISNTCKVFGIYFENDLSFLAGIYFFPCSLFSCLTSFFVFLSLSVLLVYNSAVKNKVCSSPINRLAKCMLLLCSWLCR